MPNVKHFITSVPGSQSVMLDTLGSRLRNLQTLHLYCVEEALGRHTVACCSLKHLCCVGVVPECIDVPENCTFALTCPMRRRHRTNFFKELKAWPDARKGRIRSLEIEIEREEDVSSTWLPGLECLSLWFRQWEGSDVVFPPPLTAPLSRLSQLRIRASSVTIRLPSSVTYVRIVAEKMLET